VRTFVLSFTVCFAENAMYADLVYLVWTLTGTTKLMVVWCGVLIASGASIILRTLGL